MADKTKITTVKDQPKPKFNNASFSGNEGWNKAYVGLSAEIIVRHYSPKTLEAYMLWAKKFQGFTRNKDPMSLSSDSSFSLFFVRCFRILIYKDIFYPDKSMATATLNPFITSINGRSGSVVFYCRQGKECIRAHVILRNPDTEAQRSVRRSFADAVKSWQSITQYERYKFNRSARSLQISGYNLYIFGFMTERISIIHKSAIGLCSYGNKSIFSSVSPSNKEQFTEINPFAHLKYSPG